MSKINIGEYYSVEFPDSWEELSSAQQKDDATEETTVLSADDGRRCKFGLRDFPRDPNSMPDIVFYRKSLADSLDKLFSIKGEMGSSGDWLWYTHKGTTANISYAQSYLFCLHCPKILVIEQSGDDCLENVLPFIKCHTTVSSGRKRSFKTARKKIPKEGSFLKRNRKKLIVTSAIVLLFLTFYLIVPGVRMVIADRAFDRGDYENAANMYDDWFDGTAFGKKADEKQKLAEDAERNERIQELWEEGHRLAEEGRFIEAYEVFDSFPSLYQVPQYDVITRFRSSLIIPIANEIAEMYRNGEEDAASDAVRFVKKTKNCDELLNYCDILNKAGMPVAEMLTEHLETDSLGLARYQLEDAYSWDGVTFFEEEVYNSNRYLVVERRHNMKDLYGIYGDESWSKYDRLNPSEENISEEDMAFIYSFEEDLQPGTTDESYTYYLRMDLLYMFPEENRATSLSDCTHIVLIGTQADYAGYVRQRITSTFGYSVYTSYYYYPVYNQYGFILLLSTSDEEINYCYDLQYSQARVMTDEWQEAHVDPDTGDIDCDVNVLDRVGSTDEEWLSDSAETAIEYIVLLLEIIQHIQNE